MIKVIDIDRVLQFENNFIGDTDVSYQRQAEELWNFISGNVHWKVAHRLFKLMYDYNNASNNDLLSIDK